MRGGETPKTELNCTLKYCNHTQGEDRKKYRQAQRNKD